MSLILTYQKKTELWRLPFETGGGFFVEPGKLDQVELTDGKSVITEVSERQREIPEALEMNPHPAGIMIES